MIRWIVLKSGKVMGHRICIAILGVLLWAGQVFASGMQPAELPPADFTARQYIDSRGCVFVRGTGDGWTPRLYRGEEPVCGYPPTLSGRPLGQDGAPKSPADLLAELVFPNLRDGEKVDDANPFQPLPDMGPEPFDAGAAGFLQAEIAAQSAVRHAMTGARQPNRELCRLLGYDRPISSHDPQKPSLAGDSSQGFCSGLAAGQVSLLAFARPAGRVVPTNGADPDAVMPAIAPPVDRVDTQAEMRSDVAAGRPGQSPSAAEERAGPPPVKGRVAAAPRPAARQAPRSKAVEQGVIPANARYVQIAIFSDSEQMQAAQDQLSALGLPLLRQVKPALSDGFVLLSGPFTSRQSIVMALDRIRKAGFRDAVPR